MHDKRSITVKLTEKGKQVVVGVRELEENNGMKFQDSIGDTDTMTNAIEMLRKLERTWDEYIRYGD